MISITGHKSRDYAHMIITCLLECARIYSWPVRSMKKQIEFRQDYTCEKYQYEKVHYTDCLLRKACQKRSKGMKLCLIPLKRNQIANHSRATYQGTERISRLSSDSSYF